MPNQFIWYDLATTDVAAARAFYTAVVGWRAEDSGVAGANYTIFHAADRAAAGLMPAPSGMSQPAWIGYVGVDDVDEMAAQVTAVSGQVHRAPFDIAHVGRAAVVADPQGAVFMLFQVQPCADGQQPKPPFDLGTAGCIGWNELHSTDAEAGFAFYAELFGWTKDQAIPMGPMGTYQLFRAGGDGAIGGMMNAMNGMPPHWSYYLQVDALDAAAERLTAGGGQVIHGPVEVPGGAWVLNAIDPQGGHFALLAPTR